MKEIVVKEDVERKKFEEWCKVRNEGDRLKTDVDDGDVYYVDASIDYAWQGWIARAYESAIAKQGAGKMKSNLTIEEAEACAQRAYIRTKKDRKYGCLFNDDLQELKDLAAELARMPDRRVEEITVRVQALEMQLRYINRLKYGKNLRIIKRDEAIRAGYAVASKTLNR